MSDSARSYVLGYLNWSTRLRFAAALAVSLVLFSTVGWSVVKLWDPLGAISLILAEQPLWMWLKIAALVAVVACLATVIMDGRLPHCGAFVALVGLAYLPIKTAGMDYVLVRLQAGKSPEQAAEVWLSLGTEMLAWSALMGIAMVVGRAVELSLARSDEIQASEKTAVIDQMFPSSKPFYLKGIMSTLLTTVIAGVLIVVLAASQEKGQVIFAAATGFFVAAAIAEHLTGSTSAVWQAMAVPLLAVCIYLYTYMHPDRPRPYEVLLNIPPNNLARILPIEFISVAGASAILGTWYSHKLRHDRKK